VKERDDLSTMHASMETEKLLLVSYVVNKKSGKRNVLVLSTMYNIIWVTIIFKKATHYLFLRPYDGKSRCHG